MDIAVQEPIAACRVRSIREQKDHFVMDRIETHFSADRLNATNDRKGDPLDTCKRFKFMKREGEESLDHYAEPEEYQRLSLCYTYQRDYPSIFYYFGPLCKKWCVWIRRPRYACTPS